MATPSADAASSALVEMPATALVEGGTSIPPGLRISWSERQDRLTFNLEVTEPEDPRVHIEDSGQVVVLVWSDDKKYTVKLQARSTHASWLSITRPHHLPPPCAQLRSQIDAAKARWTASGRGINFELRKMRIGRWGSLVSWHLPASAARAG